MRLTENKSVKKTGSERHKVFCQEDYAQYLYDQIVNGGPTISKDFCVGDVLQGHITHITPEHIEVNTGGGTVYLGREKETKFLHRQGVDSVEPGLKLEVIVTNSKANIASAELAFERTLKQDLMNSLKDNSSAYTVTIKSINDGGFLVDLNGLECFMPGSLSAANKVTNFESLIGNQVFVMVETYLQKSDMFVVSAKKYIKHILPSKIAQLDYKHEYTGHVTGTTKYGVFIEWCEPGNSEGGAIFTGLLHETEALENWQQLRPGTEIKFHIKEVRNDDRVILTQQGPNKDVVAFDLFKEQEGTNMEGTVVDIKNFGVFVKLTDRITGMLSPKEAKKFTTLQVDDVISVHIKEVDTQQRRVYLNQSIVNKIKGLQDSFN